MSFNEVIYCVSDIKTETESISHSLNYIDLQMHTSTRKECYLTSNINEVTTMNAYAV